VTGKTMYIHDADTIIRPSVRQDVTDMHDRVRAADRAEVWASHHHTPEQALMHGYERSVRCLTLIFKGVPVAMFGIVPEGLLDNKALVWMLGTPEIAQLKRLFALLSKPLIATFLERYPLLYNYVDCRNTTALQWLKWCGAEFGDSAQYGIEQIPFKPFLFRSDAHV
jgi:hypothetical protein